jgi:hypothetical protein
MNKLRMKTLRKIAIGVVGAVIALVVFGFAGMAWRVARVHAQMDGKILFYGKVVDHEGRPVVGAKVGYLVTQASQLARMGHDPYAEIATDENGLFKIQKKNGMSLSIRSIEKEDHRFVTAGKVFTYGFGSNSNPHRPDSQRPVEFLLVPSEFKFTDILRPESVGVRFDWNSGPVEVPIGKTGEVLILRPTRDLKPGEREGFAWKVEIEIRDGELLMKDKGDFFPLAPLGGYQKRIVIGYERDAPNWGSAWMNRQFVFRTRTGDFGKFDLSLYADRDKNSTGARLFFAFNPSGQRHLD